MGKPAIRRPALDESTYARVIMQPYTKMENEVVPVKKKTSSRTWMRFDVSGNSEILECDKNALLRRVSIPARDLRILGPIFSQSSHILARESAMVVNLEFVKTIITAEEVYLLDPHNKYVEVFVEQLRIQLPRQLEMDAGTTTPQAQRREEGLPEQLPFEFRVLEVALDVVCNYLERHVHDLERMARPALEQLTKTISRSSLELVRTVKSRLTRLNGQVQKVRDELVQLLDDDEDMADLYLTRKLLQSQNLDSPFLTIHMDDRNTASSVSRKLARLSSIRSHGHTSRRSSGTHTTATGYDVEDLEMLLEAYFMQVDASLNKLFMVREYINDTEDYVNVQLDHQRNQLFQFQITLGASALAVAVAMGLVGMFSMNIPMPQYQDYDWFTPYVLITLFSSLAIFMGVIGYVHWKGLFEK